MVSRIHLSTITLIAAAIWFASLVLEGIPVSITFFSPFGRVLSIILLLLAAFDKWAWRWRIFRGWFVHDPDLNGIWKGRFESNWTNPETGEVSSPKDARIIVSQTYSAIHIRLETDESDSELLSGGLIQKSDGTYQLLGVYRNTPRLLGRERSPIHHGSLLLDIVGNPPTALRGEYWTDRQTQGEIRFEERSMRR